MNYQTFINRLQKNTKKNLYKVRNSWGVRDAYRYIRKRHWEGVGKPVSEKDFYAVIRQINLLLADSLSKGSSIVFPQRMGELEIRKYSCGVTLNNDKLHITRPVDWNKTINLWYKDSEAKENKILIRFNEPYYFRIFYRKYRANYENLSFYRFAVNRSIKRTLKKHIISGEVDALW